MEKVEGRCVYEFGDFRVDAVQRLLVLKTDGSTLPLMSRAFEVLLYFVQHHGELLDKATLMKAIWPNAVVEENNLSQSITAIRRVLGESPGEHKFIVTVPGRGYCFVAEVKIITARPSGGETTHKQLNAPLQQDVAMSFPVDKLQVDDSPAPSEAPRIRKRTLQYVFGFILLAVLAVYAIDRMRLSPVPSAIANRVAIDRSIAVLPFENRSEDPANAYFAEGVQDEILTLLSKIGALRVISQTSDHSANTRTNLTEVARQLGVAHLLQGSVQKVGDTVRINIQLIDVASDNQLWAETYERKLTDVFAVESEVARAIAETLQAKLTGAEQRELAMKPTQNPEAYDAYLRGLVYARRPTRTAPEIKESIAAFEEAVRLDPKFAAAWAWLARRHIVLYADNHDHSPSRRNAARQALDAAIQLGPDLTETQLAKGYFLYRVESDYVSAEQALVQARQQSPNNAEAAFLLAVVAREQDRWQESVTRFKRRSRWIRRMFSRECFYAVLTYPAVN
jgi:TolB-like protein/DNA-binding winged helix-turn-helix (wHTH) protein